MADHDYQITFRADTSGAIGGMRQVEAAFRQLDSAVNGGRAGLGAMKSQLDDVADSCHHVGAAMDGAAAKGRGLTLSAVEIGKAWAITGILDAGAMAIGGIAEMATKARDHIKELAIETMGLRDKMRELANLQGQAGPDNEVLAEAVEMGMGAGMLPDDVRKYLEQFEGSAPAGVQKGHIDAKTKDELAAEGARFGTRVSLSPQTAGDLAGVIPQYTDLVRDKDGGFKPQASRKEEAMAQMGRVAYGLNEGRGNLEPLVRSLINTAGAVVADGGAVGDLGELAAIQGVASTHANPREAGTRVRQGVRALRDTRGPAGLFLKSAGVDDKDSHVERLGKVRKKLDEAKAKGVAGDVFLRGQGFTDEDEMRAVLEQANDLEIIKERIAKANQIDGKGVIKANDEFFKSDRVGVNRRLKANKAGQDFIRGQEAERYEMAKEAEDQRLRKHKGEWAYWGARVANDAGGILPKLGAMPTEERWKMQMADQTLVDKARKAGMSDLQIYSSMGVGQDKQWMISQHENDKDKTQLDEEMRQERRWHGDGDRAREFNRLSTHVERAQHDPNPEGPNIGPILGEIAREARETNRILREKKAEAEARFVGPPRPGALPPPLPPMRGAAAPKRP